MIDIVLAAQRLDPAAAQRPPARVAAASALLDRGWGKLPAFWPDNVRLSDLEERFVCHRLRTRGADVRPLFGAHGWMTRQS